MNTEFPTAKLNGGGRKRRKIHLACLEADLAYFQARLEIIGEPRTANQQAQHKAFRLLHRSFGDLIVHTKRQLVEEAPSLGAQ